MATVFEIFPEVFYGEFFRYFLGIILYEGCPLPSFVHHMQALRQTEQLKYYKLTVLHIRQPNKRNSDNSNNFLFSLPPAFCAIIQIEKTFRKMQHFGILDCIGSEGTFRQGGCPVV